jgi:16S rRNA (guanine966-N2)-methyltransferase
MTERIRITGGNRLNRRILSPPKNTIRPASDMIRQAVFNMIGDLIEGAVFYDVFAGTGIVGMEALSRGAERATFIELDRSHVQLIRKNLTLAKFGPEAVVRQGDAFVWARHFAPESGRVIVFLGPPYPLCLMENKPKAMKLVADVASRLDEDDYLILQYPREIDPSELPLNEHWVRHRHYGKTRISIWTKNGALGDPLWTVADEREAVAGADEEFDDETGEE